MTRPDKRSLLLEEGRRIALADGLRGLSLDKAAKNTSISKRTLYRYFPGREAFLAAVVDYDGACWREWFLDAVKERKSIKCSAIDAAIELLAACARTPDAACCLFARAAFEYPAPPPLLAQAIERQRTLLRSYVTKFLRESHVKQVETKAARLMLLMQWLLAAAANHSPAQEASLFASFARDVVNAKCT